MELISAGIDNDYHNGSTAILNFPKFEVVLSICLINYCSIDGSRMATCRMERFGFEPWSGAALRFVLGQIT